MRYLFKERPACSWLASDVKLVQILYPAPRIAAPLQNATAVLKELLRNFPAGK